MLSNMAPTVTVTINSIMVKPRENDNLDMQLAMN